MSKESLQYQVEAIQQSAYRQAGMEVPLLGRFAFQKMFWWTVLHQMFYENTFVEKLLASFLAMEKVGIYKRHPPISTHEIPEHYVYLTYQVQRMHQAISDNYKKIQFFFQEYGVSIEPFDVNDILVATIPVPEVNASIRKIEGSTDVLMLFNVSFLPIINAIARFLAVSINIEVRKGDFFGYSYSIETAVEHIRNYTDEFCCLHQVLRGVIYGDLSQLSELTAPPPLPLGRICQRHCSTSTSYIVSHEIGHLMLGHLDSQYVREGRHLINDDLHFSNEQQKELEADVFAFLLNIFYQQDDALESGLKESSQLFESAVITAYSAQSSLLRAYWTIEGICFNLCGESSTKSRISVYPPYGDRLNLLKQFALQIVPNQAKRIEYISDVYASIFQKVGDYFVCYAEVNEPDRQVSEYLRNGFGL